MNAPAGTGLEAILELGALADLARAQRKLGRDVIGDFIAGLEAGRQIPLAAIREAVQRQDAAVLAELCHRARGSLGMYGCKQAAAIAQAVLESAREGRCDPALVHAFEASVAATLAALEEWRQTAP